MFGIDVDAVKKNIDATNAYYGERDYYTVRCGVMCGVLRLVNVALLRRKRVPVIR